MITVKREIELKRAAIDAVARDAERMADAADLDELTRSDEEDDFLRDQIRRVAQQLRDRRLP